MSFWIEKIKINNYKSVEAAEIRLKNGLNILIGENGSGKSNILQFLNTYISAFRFMRVNKSIRNSNIIFEVDLAPLDRRSKTKFRLFSAGGYNKNKNNKIEFKNILNIKRIENRKTIFDQTVAYGNGQELMKNEEFLSQLNILAGIKKRYIRFNLPDDDSSYWISMTTKIEVDLEGFANIEEMTAYSLFYYFESAIEEFSFLDLVRKKNQPNFEEVKSVLFKVFEDFKENYELKATLAKYSPIEDLRLNPNINIFSDDKKMSIENLIVDFKVNGNWVSWNYLSDGTKRLFYLITETIGLKKGILLIEEPELGIHPHQLYLIMDFLKEQSSNKQIIISTHSPIVLDILKPEELGNIILTKMTPHGTKLSKLNRSEVAKAKEYMNAIGDLSSYWLNSDLEKYD